MDTINTITMTHDYYLIAYRQIEKEANDKKFELKKEFVRINNLQKRRCYLRSL